MRKTQTTWRRCWSRKWVRSFTAISLVVAAATCELTLPVSWAAGGAKKPVRQKPTEKMARKSDDLNAKNVVKDAPKAVADDHPLKPCIDRAEASLQAISAVKDYSAVLFKTEMVQNKLVTHNMVTKIRHEPFSVYLKYEQPHTGREVIYVEGQNKGKLLAHDTGLRSLAGTVTLLPTSKEALAENRYPITQAGMSKMLEIVIAQWRSEAQYQEVQVREVESLKLGDERCVMLESVHPQPREHFKFHKTRLYLHTDNKFPIRVEQYLWPESEGGEPVLVEEYTFTQIKPNLGLTDMDFNKANPAYQF